MTPRPSPRQAAPLPPTEVVHAGSPHATWCAACKAWTGVAGATLLLTPDGVTTLGTWAGCQICTEVAQ